jgi:hypothetical protein
VGGDLPPVRPLDPLDPAERLPREALRRGWGGLQFRTMEGPWRRLRRPEVVAAIAVPSLILLGVAVGESHVPWPVGIAAFAVLIAALVGFALSGRNHRAP